MRRLVALLTCALLASACGGGSDDEAAPSPSASPTPAVLDGMFDVDHGRKLHLFCEGSGSPTILLEAGGQSSSQQWPGTFSGALAAKTRTCSYDRAGTGQSDPAPERKRVMKDVVADLEALLAAAHVDGPLLLVGSSFGGGVVLDYAFHNPSRVAGLVIFDTDWPTADLKRSPDQDLPASVRAEEAAGDRWDAPDNIENIAFQELSGEIESAFRPLPGIPIRILSATQYPECDQPPAACARHIALAVRLQRQWLRLSPTAVQVKVDSSHDIVSGAPDVALRETLTALAAA